MWFRSSASAVPVADMRRNSGDDSHMTTVYFQRLKSVRDRFIQSVSNRRMHSQKEIASSYYRILINSVIPTWWVDSDCTDYVHYRVRWFIFAAWGL